MGHLLGAENLHVELQDRVVLESVTLGIAEGDRIGVVGRNGEGKTTLLRLLAGRLRPDSGRVAVRRGVAVKMLSQAGTPDPAKTVAEAVAGNRPEHEWAGDPRIRGIFDGLLGGVAWTDRVGELSGGQRRRAALAAILAHDSDVLLLDEPTNHLDIEGITWLAAHLKRRWPPDAGGLVVVTHDRWFLDEVCRSMWEVRAGTLEPFEGGYAAYILQRVERDRLAAAAEAKRQNLLRKELAWLRRGPPARTSKPKFRVEAANALIADEPPPRDRAELVKMATSRLGRQVVDLIDASVDYGDKAVLRNIEWLLQPGERTGILGPNGAGKTTLLKLVTGEVQPTRGKVRRGKTVKVGYLTQEPDELDRLGSLRVSEVLKDRRNAYVAGREVTPAQLLERLGFRSGQLSSPVNKLSGGQKRRLQLLLILLDEPNVLLLDEPSNDLDTDMLAAMEDLLDGWPGTLLVVSHDRYLMERVTDQQRALIDGRLVGVPGGVEQYLQMRRDVDRASHRPPPAAKPPARAGREARREIASIERKLAKVPHQIAGINELIANHDQSDYQGLQGLVEELRALQAKLSDLETRWLQLSEQLEDAG